MKSANMDEFDISFDKSSQMLLGDDLENLMPEIPRRGTLQQFW